MNRKCKKEIIDYRKVFRRVFSLVIALIVVLAGLTIPEKKVSAAEQVCRVSNFADLVDALENDAINTVIVTECITLPDQTVLNGHGKLVSVETPYLSECGLVNASCSDYTVFYVAYNTTVTIKNMTIYSGYDAFHADDSGAIIDYGTLYLNNVTISRSYRGLYIGRYAEAVLQDTNIIRNASKFGAGIVCKAGTLVMDGCSLSENRIISGGFGGGAMEINSGGRLYANNTIIANNSSAEIGGAINNYQSYIYIMNSTITGNVTTSDELNSLNYGGGFGLNEGELYAVNCILLDNKHIAAGTGTVTPSDVGIYRGNNGLQGLFINCIYGTVQGDARYIKTVACKEETPDDPVYANYCQDGIYYGENSKTTAFKRPILITKSGNLNALYTPASASGAACSDGIDTYFDYSDLSNIKMSYGAENTAITATVPTTYYRLEAAPSDKKVTSYYEGGTRVSGVIGACSTSDAVIYNVKLDSVPTGGSVYGATLIGVGYPSGTSVTVKAVADSTHAFEGWWVNGEKVSTSQEYTFTLTGHIALSASFNNHIHEWVYSKEGTDQLKAHCNAAGHTGDDVLLTLIASNATYSGNAVSASFQTGEEDAWKAAVGTDKVPVIMYALKNSDNTYGEASSTAPVNAGTYKAAITAIDDTTKTASVEYTISAKTITPVMEDISAVTYDAQEKKPAVTVTGDGKTLVSGTDYTVEYTNNTNVGTATATVTLKGNYAGTASKSFTIKKADQSITAPTASSKTETSVTLTALTGNGATKYGYNTTNTAPGTWSESNVISGLTADTTYYFFAKFEGNENYNPVTSTGTAITTNDHVHARDAEKHHDEVSATCIAAGTREYWGCTDSTCTAKLDTNSVEIDNITIAIDANAHDWGTPPSYGHDETNHWEVCSRDSEHIRSTAVHSGGTATCQSKAVCSTCQQEYGEFGNHSWGTWNASAGTRACTNTGCSATDTCNHTGMTSSNETCSTCGKTNSNYVAPHTHNSDAYGYNATQHWTKCTEDENNNGTPENHSGGTATCQSKAVCTTCQQEYGNLGNHSWGTWNASTGTRACTITGCLATDTCTHGEATTGTCGTCGMNLGSPAHEHSYAETWSSNADGHWHECSCKDKADSAAHDALGENGACSVCGYASGQTPEPTPDPQPQPVPAPAPEPSPAPATTPVVSVIDESNIKIDIVEKDKTAVVEEHYEEVEQAAYNLSVYKTLNGFNLGLNQSIQNEQTKNETAVVKSDSVSVYTGYACTFNKKTAEICLNSKVDIVYYFEHMGHLFKVTIPAGTDLTGILDENGFAGPLWIGKQLGTAVLLI